MNKNPLKPHSIKLLRRIQKKIKEAPTSFDMGIVVAKEADKGCIPASVDLSHSLFPPCRTTACIGGWVNIMSGAKQITSLIGAGEILQLHTHPKDYINQKGDYDYVFLSSCWPRPFKKQDMELDNRLIALSRELDIGDGPAWKTRRKILSVIKKRGKVAIARIEHLIQTGE